MQYLQRLYFYLYPEFTCKYHLFISVSLQDLRMNYLNSYTKNAKINYRWIWQFRNYCLEEEKQVKFYQKLIHLYPLFDVKACSHAWIVWNKIVLNTPETNQTILETYFGRNQDFSWFVLSVLHSVLLLMIARSEEWWKY